MVRSRKGGKSSSSGSVKSLASKLGDQLHEAHEAHKDDEVVVSQGGSLPSEMSGTAQLTECKFDVYKSGKYKGEFFFYAHGVCLAPKTFGGIKTQGKLTSIGPEPICETPGRKRETIEDHIAWIYNEMRKLGVDTTELDPDSLEDVAVMLKEEKPIFSFRTWGGPTKKDPTAQVRSEWEGLDEDFVADTDNEVDEDEDDDDDDDDDEEEDEEPAPKRRTTKKTTTKKPTKKTGRRK